MSTGRSNETQSGAISYYDGWEPDVEEPNYLRIAVATFVPLTVEARGFAQNRNPEAREAILDFIERYGINTVVRAEQDAQELVDSPPEAYSQAIWRAIHQRLAVEVLFALDPSLCPVPEELAINTEGVYADVA